MRLAVLLACCVFALPCSAKDVFRCIHQSGAVEYRDSPCTPGAGGKVELQNASVSETDQESAYQALRQVKEELRAIDQRTIARAIAAREARAAEERDEERALRLAELSALTPRAIPEVAFVPVFVDAGTTRPWLSKAYRQREQRRQFAPTPTPLPRQK